MQMIKIRRILIFSLVILVFLSALCFQVLAVPEVTGRPGEMSGVRLWTLPNGPNNSVIPDQCWHSVGCGPDGDIYISGMDHVNNAGLYRLYVQEDMLRWLGDARTASQAVNNWQSGETAQKFHGRPTYIDGKVYVATTDRTDVGGAYLSTRGFHWYAYDIASNTFNDMSVSQSGGVGAAHLQILTIGLDPKNKILYGAANACGNIARYNLNTGVSEDLGKSPKFTQYIYVNRYMWVDSRGILYFTAGSSKGQWNQGEDPAVYSHVFTYNPSSGFGERTDFPLVIKQCIEVGQWTRDRQYIYVMSDRGDLYRFSDAGPSWTFLKSIFGTSNDQSVWSIQLSLDEKKIYSFYGSNSKQLVEYDIASNTVRTLAANVSELSTEAAGQSFITGYNAWDDNGCFYGSSFTMYGGGNTRLLRVDPVRLKVAKGLLSALVEVSVAYSSGTDEAIFTRTGATSAALEVLYRVDGLNSSGTVLERSYKYVNIPAGSASVAVPATQLLFTNPSIVTTQVKVLGDGNDYVNKDPRVATIRGTAPTPPANTPTPMPSPTPTSGPSSKPIPGQIEAESYNAMSGIQTETTSDTGGGLNVGWIEANDWMDYNVNVNPAGTYLAEYRVASPNATGAFSLKNGGTVLGSYTVPNTGGWQAWTTISGNVTLTAGVQTLRILATGTGWNINWMKFTQGSGPTPTPTPTPPPGPTATPTPTPTTGPTPTPLPGGSLLSQGKPATASSFQAGNEVAKGNDGSLTTRWAASGATFPQWWKVDLNAGFSLSRVDINWYSSASRSFKYKIEVSADNVTFTTVVDKTGNTATGDTSDSFSATGRYVRITITGASAGWASAYEFKVYGN
jgi:hypothetical protein